MSLKRLQRPTQEGGINLLDLPTRNQAIEITWLSAYINTSPSRPTWAYVADALINTLQPKGIKNTTELAAFLTNWSPPTRGPRTRSLPREILSLLQSAKHHNVSFAPLKLSRHLKEQLPAWFHLGAPPRTYFKKQNECHEFSSPNKSQLSMPPMYTRSSQRLQKPAQMRHHAERRPHTNPPP